MNRKLKTKHTTLSLPIEHATAVRDAAWRLRCPVQRVIERVIENGLGRAEEEIKAEMQRVDAA